MANLYATDFGKKLVHTAEYGNSNSEDYTVERAAAVGDKLYFGVIPAGSTVHNVTLLRAACGAGAQLDVGFEPAEGAEPAASAAYFFDNLDVAAAGRAESSAFPLRLERDVYLVGTVVGANFTGTPRVTLVVAGKFRGAK